jgi:Ala-tRNA(Pro) deacylase
MPCERLKKFMDAENVPYICIPHSGTYTAQTTAHATHVSGRVLAKTLIMDLDGEIAMVVVPANQRVVPEDIRELTDCERIKLVPEEVFKHRFPDCETGAMPPFGNLYGMNVYLASALSRNKDIAFNAGSHSEVILMAYKDYEQLVKPKVLELAA